MSKYKKIIYFALTFIAIAVVDIFIFSGVFSQIFVDKLSWVLDNTILSLLIFFWMFIAFPSIVSYYVAFVLIKNKTNEITEKQENTVEKTQVKTAVVATIVLGVAVTIFIRWATAPRFLPYTFHPVSESEFNRPTPTPVETKSQLKILLSKNITDKTYYLTDGDTKTVFLYKGQEAKEKVWTQVLPVDESRVKDFWYDESNDNLFTIEGRGPSIGGDTYEEIALFTRSGEEIHKKTLVLFKPGIYAGTRIVNYYKENGRLLLETMGGDGCGGGGKIWFAGDSFNQTILEFGAGCAYLEKPRYIGFTGNLLVFADYDKTIDFDKSPILKIYTINPLTLARETLIEKPNLPENITYAKISDEDKNNIILTSLSKETYRFDIEKKIIEKIQLNSQTQN